MNKNVERVITWITIANIVLGFAGTAIEHYNRVRAYKKSKSKKRKPIGFRND